MKAAMKTATMKISGEVSMQRAQNVNELSIKVVAKTPPVWSIVFRGGRFRWPFGGGCLFFVTANWLPLATESWPLVASPPRRSSSSVSLEQRRRWLANGWSFSNRSRSLSVDCEVIFKFWCASWLEFALFLLQRLQWRELLAETSYGENPLSSVWREEDNVECEHERDLPWTLTRLREFESEVEKFGCKVLGASVRRGAVCVSISAGIGSAKTSSSSFDSFE